MVAELSFDAVAESMRLMAIAGLKDCFDRLRQLPNQDLVPFINPSENSIKADLAGSRLKLGTTKRFYPLPVPSKGFYLAFFRPVFTPAPNPSECSIDVLMVAKGSERKVVGFRFERGIYPDDTHAYPHMQLTRAFRDGPSTDWPEFTPISYPAFPTRCRAMGDTWLAVLVSLYGLSANDDLGLAKIAISVDEARRTNIAGMLIQRSRLLFDA